MFRCIMSSRGPIAAPGNPFIYDYSGGKKGIQWEITDPTAWPEVRIGGSGDPTARLSPGTFLWDSGGFDANLWVRYWKHGKVTEWVSGGI